MAVYLANAFSPSMLQGAMVAEFIPKTPEEWASDVKTYAKLGVLHCVIGHPGTAKLAEELVGMPLNCRREAIRVNSGDTIYIVTLNFRAPEGKVYNADEVKQLYREGKIAFWEVRIFGSEE